MQQGWYDEQGMWHPPTCLCLYCYEAQVEDVAISFYEMMGGDRSMWGQESLTFRKEYRDFAGQVFLEAQADSKTESVSERSGIWWLLTLVRLVFLVRMLLLARRALHWIRR